MPVTYPSSSTSGATVDSVTRAADQAAILAAHDAYGVISGCAVTATSGNMVVSVAAGTTQHGVPGNTATVIAQTVTATNNVTGLSRYDAVIVSSAGVVSIVAGTAATNPLFPAVTAGSVELAVLLVPTGATVLTTATNVIDKRVVISTGPWVNVKDYGARGDVRRYADGAITTGTATFTSATATFVAADKGKTITISGAGAAGVVFTTTISSVTNGTTVVLAANASTTVSAKNFRFGTDDASAIAAGMAAASGSVLFFPSGFYGSASALTHNTSVVVRGAGMDTTAIITLGDGFTLLDGSGGTTAANSYMAVEEITLWGPGDLNPTQDTLDNRLSKLRADRIRWRRVHAIYSRQMSLTGVGTYEARAENCVIEKGMRDGINATGSARFTAIGNTCQEIADDAIAFHIQQSLPVGTIASPSCAIVGNVMNKCSGIKILGGTNAVITGNSGRFLIAYGVFMDFDTVFGEGNKDTLGVTVTGNSFMDIIYGTVVGGAGNGVGIYVASPEPQQGATLGRTVTNGTTSAASANLTSATIAWTTADEGKSVTVTGAGVAGATLSTRILSVTSGTVAVMETPATTAVTGTATIQLSLLAYYPAMTSAGTGTKAVKGPATNSWNGVSGAATGAYGLVISNNTIEQTLDGLKTDGTAATTFSDYGFGNLWWTSGSVNPSFVTNIGTLGTTLYRGVHVQNGALRDCTISNNSIYGMLSSVYLGATPTLIFPEVSIIGNKFTRCKIGIESVNGGTSNVNYRGKDNDFNLDPLFEAAERTVVSSQPTGTWTITTGTSSCAMYLSGAWGVELNGNRFRNCGLITPHNNEVVTLINNVIQLDASVTSPSFGGVNATDTELCQSTVVQYIADPRLTTYGTVQNGYSYANTAMPSTGAWTKGAFIKNSAPTLSGGITVQGWLRLTSGTGNVAGTDWVAVFTGTPASNAVSSVTGYATDTYLAGSAMFFPVGGPVVGTTYKLKFYVAKTAAGTATPIITLRMGTAATTADAAICVFTFGAGTVNADEGVFEVLATFRTVGASTSAVVQGVSTLVNNLTITGISNAVKAKTVTSSGFASTTAGLIVGVSYNAGTGASHTTSLVHAELV